MSETFNRGSFFDISLEYTSKVISRRAYDIRSATIISNANKIFLVVRSLIIEQVELYTRKCIFQIISRSISPYLIRNLKNKDFFFSIL